MEDFESKYTGAQVDALLDIVSQGGSGGGEVQKTTEAEILAMGFTKNEGTITGVKMNGVSKGTSGVVDLGAVVTDVSGKQDKITDLATIRSGASAGATAVQPGSLAKVATSGSYNDLSDKPTIPAEVTESTISGWGFTKNTGTYSKPSGGIPKTDLASAVQTSLDKADSAVQPNDISEFVTAEDLAAVATSGSYNDLTDKPNIPNADSVKTWGFAKGVKVNGSVKTPSAADGIVDLGTISGGGGSSSGGGGSMEYIEIEPEIEPGGAQLTLTSAEPNKVYIVTEELFYLEIQSFVEPNGLEGEYRFHFKAFNCMIVLPDSVLWANGQMPHMIDGICELSIIGTRYQGEVVYKAVLTSFS